MLVSAAVPWGWLGCLFLAGLAWMCARWGHALAEQRFAVLDACCALGMVCFLVALAGRAEGRPCWLEQRALVASGRISYSLYLVHAPLLQLLWQYGLRDRFQPGLDQFVALLLFGVPLAWGAAWLFFQLVERPFCPESLRHAGMAAGSSSVQVGGSLSRSSNTRLRSTPQR